MPFLLLSLGPLEEEITINYITESVCITFEEMGVSKSNMDFVFQLFLFH